MIATRTCETVYGTVDWVVLQELRQSFDTSQLLAAIDIVNASGLGEDGRCCLASSLRCLHGMASHLIDDAAMSITSEQPIWQLAEELEDALEASAAGFVGIFALVGRLGALRPSDV